VSAFEQAAAWLAGRSPRERTVLGIAAAVTLAVVAASGVLGVRDDLAALRARVAGHERELGEVRRLAALLRRGGAPAARGGPDESSLLTRLEAAAAGVVGRERIAGMTPATAALEDGVQEERVALRLAGASLPEVVRLLHAVEAGDAPLDVARLELRKHPDDASRFDATIEVVRLAGSAP
jgi:hypothetical protein